MAEYDYLQEILKTVSEEGHKYSNEANLLAGIIKGLQYASEMMYRWSENTGEHTPIKFHEVADELEDLTREVLIDHPAFPYIRKDYPKLEKKQEHVRVIATRGKYQHLMNPQEYLT